jgi:hypothetical protein
MGPLFSHSTNQDGDSLEMSLALSSAVSKARVELLKQSQEAQRPNRRVTEKGECTLRLVVGYFLFQRQMAVSKQAVDKCFAFFAPSRLALCTNSPCS